MLYNDNFWHEDAQMNMSSPACLIKKKSKTGTSLFLFICYCLLSNRQQRKFIMVFSKEDRILIQNLYEFKGYGAKRLIKEFPQKGWKLRGLNYLLKRLRETGTTDRLSGIQQSVIDHAIDQWRVRINACVKAKGKHFKHML